MLRNDHETIKNGAKRTFVSHVERLGTFDSERSNALERIKLKESLYCKSKIDTFKGILKFNFSIKMHIIWHNKER